MSGEMSSRPNRFHDYFAISVERVNEGAVNGHSEEVRQSSKNYEIYI